MFLGTLSGLMAGRREKKLERREAKSRKAFADVRGPVRGVQMPIYALRIPEMPRVQVPTPDFSPNAFTATLGILLNRLKNCPG